MNNDSNSGEKKNPSNKTKTKSNVHKWVVFFFFFKSIESLQHNNPRPRKNLY